MKAMLQMFAGVSLSLGISYGLDMNIHELQFWYLFIGICTYVCAMILAEKVDQRGSD